MKHSKHKPLYKEGMSKGMANAMNKKKEAIKKMSSDKKKKGK